ncbi:Hsp20/alpha crystallin family protein [Leptolyngbya sp. CCNP1308]|uniref:Hsp20/alpha crystallin family protein n=1 Tax=Leptolyngbya sp. CCNP1308 TaxID=3110255 RepID=UPI002B1EC9BD|nr:Hsp20/alpha crystallin family protein [Leptolyngbya sp. CCNP1308]MEA5452861.1 Hsp20/alpha crystallin family protein [Leptolyngbya sp. CCNP1308]
MIIRRYLDPITEINAIRRQINDAFGDLTTEALAKSDWAPAIRLVDRGNEFVLTAHLVGVTATDLDVQVSADVVSISGTRQQPEAPAEVEAKVLYDDTRYGSFQRMVNLPDAVQNDQVVADFSHGVLTLTLPKVVEARNKVVKISLGGTAAPAIEAGEA